ncbi:MAG: hypothetical protein K1000chlam1_00762 [Candidatus Anoxychlamydiales bacterium]|nr:hypothetical protein [Candidatus Anoxychlamydiales bacterium]
MAIENTQSPIVRDGNLAWFSLDSNESQKSSMGIFRVDVLRKKYQEYSFGLKIFDYQETQHSTKRLGFTQVETEVLIKNSSMHKVFIKVRSIAFFILSSLKSLFGYVKGIFIKKTDDNKPAPTKQTLRKPDETIKEKTLTKGSPFWFSKNFVTRERHWLGLLKKVDITTQRYKEYFLGLNIFNKYKTTTEEKRAFFWHRHTKVEVENGLIHRTFTLIGSIFSYSIEKLNVGFGYIKAPFIKKADKNSKS